MSIFFNNEFNEINKEIISSFPMRTFRDAYPKDFLNNQSMWSYIRILHAFPKNIDVDVYINQTKVADNLNYARFTDFFHITGGIQYTLKISPKDSTAPIFTTTLEVDPAQIYTIALVGTKKEDASILLIPEPEFKINPSISYLRFCNLSPNSAALDVSLPDKTKLFLDVQYQEYTEYIELYPKKFTFEIKTFASGDDVLYVPNISLGAGKVYTMYFIGLYQGNPKEEVLIPLDGNTYIDL